jgi:dihydropteroate synthase
MTLTARGRTIKFPRRPLIMGIVNINTDSFSDDGSLDINHAIQLARDQTAAGADIIDVGGESAGTNRTAISIEEEINRTTPFFERFEEAYHGLCPVDALQVFPPLLSINTWRSPVAEMAFKTGVHLLNDMSALPTDDNAIIAARHNAALLIMHSVGQPKQKHTHIQYKNILGTLDEFFERKIKQATKAGLSLDSIVLDPGIDFAKQKEDNLRIYQQLARLTQFERPILLAVSRKTVIHDVLGIQNAADRDAGTIACVVAGTHRGASIFRVHNVRAVSQVLRVIYPVIQLSGNFIKADETS